MNLNPSQPSTSSFGTQSQSSTASAFSSLASIPGHSSSFNSTSSIPSLSQETTGVTTSTTGSTLVDPNSPELFKQNVQIALEQVARLNALARSALNGLQHAYQADVHPAQTQADLTALDQAIYALADVLRQSGVGAYPLPVPVDGARNAASPPTEQQLIADTTRGVQQSYEVFKRMQESSAVVANLLAAPENLGRPKMQ
ncbi:hypothetical protein J3R82DRAFT_7009 [Butyriboletus roseoflavus]|nr:hypothetical protein J3R82DRAFT_7009 [Butyriboletus roseoflavus]